MVYTKYILEVMSLCDVGVYVWITSGTPVPDIILNSQLEIEPYAPSQSGSEDFKLRVLDSTSWAPIP